MSQKEADRIRPSSLAHAWDLTKLSSSELSDLLSSEMDHQYDHIVDKSSMIKDLVAERDLLVASTRSLAEFNLAKRNEYESLRAQLLTLVGDCNQLKERTQMRVSRLTKVKQKSAPESILSLISGAAMDADTLTDRMVENYLVGSIEHDRFVNHYVSERKVAHLRRIKADKLSQRHDQGSL